MCVLPVLADLGMSVVVIQVVLSLVLVQATPMASTILGGGGMVFPWFLVALKAFATDTRADICRLVTNLYK